MRGFDIGGRMRRYWQGLLIAAAVSYGQLDDSSWIDVRAAQSHPFVYMIPEEQGEWSPLERVGDTVLTRPLELSSDRVWN